MKQGKMKKQAINKDVQLTARCIHVTFCLIVF